MLKKNYEAKAYTFFLFIEEGTSLYASFLSILVIYLIAMRSPQFGQNKAP